MKLDLTYNIRRLLSPLKCDPSYRKEDLEICALDDLDERYTIKAKEGDCEWLNGVRYPLQFEKISSPEKGFIEIIVRKAFPQYPFFDRDGDEFAKDVSEYFTNLFNGNSIFGTAFRMKEDFIFDKADTSYMKYSSEGDELGWVQRESDVYIGSIWTLDAPTIGDEEGYAYINEDIKDFILRKLEAIFHMKGAYCRETPREPKEKALDDLFHYEFIISNF